MNRELLNVLKLCEDYQTNGLNWAWWGRKSTTQKEKEVLVVHIDYPDIDFCLRTKTYISYSPTEKLIYLSDSLKLAPNHWISTLISDVANNRITIEKYYVGVK